MSVAAGYRLCDGERVENPLPSAHTPALSAAPSAPARAGSLASRTVRTQPQEMDFKDPWWKVALSCFPIVGGIMEIINRISTNDKCKKLKEPPGDKDNLIKAIEQKNRHNIYAIISYAIPIIALITLLAVGILSAGIGIIAPIVMGACYIGLDAYFIANNKKHIHKLETEPGYIEKPMRLF
jgi:hypothetical protein